MDRLDRYVRTDSRTVEGWLRPEAADLIAHLARSSQTQGAVGEIGVHHGKLFILLSLCRRPGEAGVAIDLFESQDLNIDHSGAGDRGKFDANLARLDPEAGGVIVQSADSTTLTSDALQELAGGAYRLFSVDGGHTADITASDLTVSSHALAEGGLLILDDYFNVSWPGVSEGANRFLASDPPVVPFASGHGKMFLTHASAADRYREAVAELAAKRDWKLSEQPFFDLPHTIVQTRPRPTAQQRAKAWARSTRLGNKAGDQLRARRRHETS